MHADHRREAAQRSHHPQWLARTSVALACSLFAAGALAQATAGTAETDAQASTKAGAETTNALPTVTVTARKRKELLMDVPISMQAISERELRSAGITDIKDLGEQTGFTFSSATGTSAQGRSFGVITFRGLQGDLTFPWENSGGVFIDGIFLSGGVSGVGMGDVARVEVLKGPQNAFFGRSTFGGAVNFITSNPSSTFKGTVNASIDHKGTSDVDATLQGPLTEKLGARISFGSRSKAAQFQASDGGDLGAETSKFVSGTLYFAPTADLWMRLRGHYQRDEDSAPAMGFFAAAGNTSCASRSYTGQTIDRTPISFTPSVAYFCDRIPNFKDVGSGIFDANTALPAVAVDPMVNNSLKDPFLAKTPRIDHMGMVRESTRVSAQMGLLLPKDMDLAVNAGYNESKASSIHDLDRSKTFNFLALQTNPTKDLTLDARLSTDAQASLRGLIGVSYFKSVYQMSQVDFSPAFGQAAPTISTGAYLNLRSTVPAIYGSVEYDLNPQWTVSAEARYQTDKSEFTSQQGTTTGQSISNLLPRLTLRYKPAPGISTYVNLAQGVQPLTTNGGYVNANASGKAYLEQMFPGISPFTKQPKLDSIELGVKQQVSRSFQYALAVYDQKWRNRLSGTTVFNPASCGRVTDTPECPFSTAGSGVTITNQARVRGLELVLEAQLTPSWSAGGYIDYKKAYWTTFDAANASVITGSAVAFDGNELGRQPKLSVTANSTYRYAFSNGWTGYTRGDLTYVGKRWDSDFNIVQADGYSRFDVRQGFEGKDVLVEFFVRNLFDNRGWQSISRYPNLSLSPLTNYSQQGMQVTVQESRTVGARLRFGF
ncbi:TonB-dependent receptor [Roseateles sp. LYH14W]|uniref:TonB-dependent receptor n=1 Tax=Pelomonas parva TaxID=3299032 RepID=A0ABW7F0V2_9BURK